MPRRHLAGRSPPEMYQRVLLPLDGSDLAEAAIPWVIELVRLSQGDVVLLQAIQSPSQLLISAGAVEGGGGGGDFATAAIREQRSAAECYLEEVRGHLAAQITSKLAIEIVEGRPQEAICEVAHRLNVDVIVMATHGRSGLKRAVLGSVADHVVRSSPGIAVLVVRPEVEST